MILPIPSEEDTTEVVGRISAFTKIQVEPVGRWFEALCLRKRHKHSLSHKSLSDSSSSSSEEEEDDADENDDSLLLSLDPKEWKNQDHYAVLGLGNLRYKATDAQIKKAYKKKVLHHHPDKRRARGLQVKDGEDDYFTCITRAWETLGTTAKKRSYDSIDPQFDDSVPSVSPASKENFYEIFRPVFERNARWSNKKRVHQLGDDSADFEQVNRFYAFWYEFDSWREFSYLDEEEKEKGENRDERRWIEKQNKAARQKRKKEEMARIRQLVDNAYACDPRIQRFKDEEKEKKAALKAAKQAAARQRQEEEEKKRKEAEEEERKRKAEEEEKAKAEAAAAKKEREAQKKVFKKERKTLRTLVKDFDYFAGDEAEKVYHMTELDKLAEQLDLLQLQSLNAELSSGDNKKAKAAFQQSVQQLNAKIEAEKRQFLEASSKSSSDKSSRSGKQWSETELQTLIKGVNVFPAGTKDRWEVICNFIKQHVSDSDKNAKDVLAKAKELQKNDLTLKSQATEKAYENFEKEQKKGTTVAKPKEGVVSERFESIAEQQIREMGSNPAPWTAEEQKLLEQALKTFPANTPDRWDRVAEAVSNRSKKDCMKRYKELVELVRAKKAAQDAAASKSKK